MEFEQSLATKIELLNEKIDEIKIEQDNIKKELKQKNKIIMRKLQKIQEFCEIQEMQNKIFSRDINKCIRKWRNNI